MTVYEKVTSLKSPIDIRRKYSLILTTSLKLKAQIKNSFILIETHRSDSPTVTGKAATRSDSSEHYGEFLHLFFFTYYQGGGHFGIRQKPRKTFKPEHLAV
jgi:hypothetical protein